MKKYLLYLVVAFIVVWLLRPAVLPRTLGGATPGLPASNASTTLEKVGPTLGLGFNIIVATSTCSARIITTAAQPIMLTLTDSSGQTPTATFGHLQAASTTVAYDSGLYGCDAVRAYGYAATTSITVTDIR